MKLSILSDIHSNLEALETTLNFISAQEVDKILFLGDIVGYGANPSECIEIAKKEFDISLLGNHDSAAIDMTNINYFNDLAKAAILWTKSVLRQTDKMFLARLPLKNDGGIFFAVHSTPKSPELWDYILKCDDAIGNFNYFSTDVCFIGHSHVPAIFCESGEQIDVIIPYEENSFSYRLARNKRYIVNVGSVGQPRDRDPRGCFTVFDSETRYLIFYRFDYDIEKAQRKILSSSLPPFLAHRLRLGV